MRPAPKHVIANGAAPQVDGVRGLDLGRLAETAEFGRGLISSLPGVGLLLLDRDLRILVTEGDVLRASEDLVGRPVAEVVPAGAWATLEPRCAAALAGEVQVFDYEASDGRSTYAVRIAAICDRGAVAGLMLLTQDISATVAAARSLLEGERRQREVLDALDEGVLVLGLDGRLSQANAAACAILGLVHEVACADPEWWSALATRWSGRSPLDVGAEVVRTGGGVADVEVELSRPSGAPLLLAVDYRPLRDDADAISGLVLSLRDVSSRARERHDLVEIEEALREAHEVARLASWEWDPVSDDLTILQSLAEDGAPPGTRTSMEDRLREMTPEDADLARDDVSAIMRGDRDVSIRRSCHEYPIGTVWLETRIKAVRDADGRVVLLRGTSQDVTEQELATRRAAVERDMLQSTLDSLSAHIAVLDAAGEVIMVNRAWEQFGAENGAVSNGGARNYLAACDLAPDDRSATEAAAGLRAIMAGERDAFTLQYPCVGPSDTLWFELRAEQFDGPGEARVVVAHEDVTARVAAEEEVATQAALLDEVDASVVVTGVDGRITYWNRGAEDLYGWSSREAIGRLASPLLNVETERFDDRIAAEMARNRRWEGETIARRKDGSTFPRFLRLRDMTDADGRTRGQIGVSVDLSERVAAERELVAARDYLRAVADNIGEGMYTLDAEGRLMYMNASAERMLGWTASELRGSPMHDVVHFRRADGSALPAEECPIRHARHNGLTRRVDDDLFITRDGRELPVAYTAAPFETADGVEGCVVVFADISERKAQQESLQREAEKLAWIERIQEALAEDRFVLFAQPIIDLHTGDTVQRELLLRVREPSGRIVGPGEFLSVAEQYGLIGAIDRWVIARGAEIAATGCAVEVNVSGPSIGDPTILRHIEDCIERFGVDPRLMVFEVTETALVEDHAAALVFTERLHELGCKLALDDFGTGYGGFTYLKQLPVDYLKIDIEFVRDLASNPASRHVVEAVVALARGFRLQTVAEGVEDAETLALLEELGVDFAQGYYIARPAPIDLPAAPTVGPDHVGTTGVAHER